MVELAVVEEIMPPTGVVEISRRACTVIAVEDDVFVEEAEFCEPFEFPFCPEVPNIPFPEFPLFTFVLMLTIGIRTKNQ